jgi:hypothetical protein
MNRLYVGLGLASMIAAPALGDVVPPSVRCQIAKIWIAGRYVARHPRCRTAACSGGWARGMTHKSVHEWLERWHDGESLEHVTIDGADALRTTTTFEEENQRRLDILVPGKPLGIALSASWYIGDDHHPDDVEQMIQAGRFFGYAKPVRRIDEAK